MLKGCRGEMDILACFLLCTARIRQSLFRHKGEVVENRFHEASFGKDLL